MVSSAETCRVPLGILNMQPRHLSPFRPSLGVSQDRKRRRGLGSSVPLPPITDMTASWLLSPVLDPAEGSTFWKIPAHHMTL